MLFSLSMRCYPNPPVLPPGGLWSEDDMQRWLAFRCLQLCWPEGLGDRAALSSESPSRCILWASVCHNKTGRRCSPLFPAFEFGGRCVGMQYAGGREYFDDPKPDGRYTQEKCLDMRQAPKKELTRLPAKSFATTQARSATALMQASPPIHAHHSAARSALLGGEPDSAATYICIWPCCRLLPSSR